MFSLSDELPHGCHTDYSTINVKQEFFDNLGYFFQNFKRYEKTEKREKKENKLGYFMSLYILST